MAVEDHPDLPLEQLEQSFLLAAVAARNFDLLVTHDGAFAGAEGRRIAARANPLTPTEPCVVVGLLCRARGVQPLSRQRKMDPGSFNLLLARALTPASVRWTAAYQLSAGATGDPALGELVDSVRLRLVNALEARDGLHQEIYRGARARWFPVLSRVDTVLLMLSAAFDVTALVANQAYNLSGNSINVGWRRKDWMNKLLQASPALGAFMGKKTTAGGACLSVIASLRNTIHEQALAPTMYGGRALGEQILVRVPRIASLT